MAKIYLEYEGKRYELVETKECTKVCAFRTADGHGFCEAGCYLPEWYIDLIRKMDYGDITPKEVKDEQA